MGLTRMARWILASLACASFLAACGGKNAASSQTASAAPPAPVEEASGAAARRDRRLRRPARLSACRGLGGDRSAQRRHRRRSPRAAIHRRASCKSFGCPVDQEDFHTPTPIGNVAMKNIVAKVPGASPDILMFTTHYDSKLLPNFVGADDGGSSTGVMLELARLVCARKNAMTVWIAFFDGEEAFKSTGAIPTTPTAAANSPRAWRSPAILPHVKPSCLADIVGVARPALQARVQFDSLAHGYGLVHGGEARLRQHFRHRFKPDRR